MDFDTQRSTRRPNLWARHRVDHSYQLAVSDSEDITSKRRKRIKQHSGMEELVTMMTQVIQWQQTLLKQQQIQHRPMIEIANYQGGEGIANFLEAFEGIMRLHQVPKQDWVTG